jgi:hypothetical protein
MISSKPSVSLGALKRRPKSPKAMPGREVRDSGFCAGQWDFFGAVSGAYQFFVEGSDGIVMFAEIWGGNELDAADGDLEFFGEIDPVRSCFFVGVGIVCLG